MARGIDVANARPGPSRPASVNPIFTWWARRNAFRCASTSIRWLTACVQVVIRKPSSAKE
jgi:hypothetical protein